MASLSEINSFRSLMSPEEMQAFANLAPDVQSSIVDHAYGRSSTPIDAESQPISKSKISLSQIAKSPEIQNTVKQQFATQAGGQLAGNAANQAVASSVNGGVLLANGSEVPGVATSVNGGTVLADQSVVGGAPTTSGTPGFSIGSPSYAGYLAAAGQGINSINNFHNVPDKMKATKLQQDIGLTVGDVYTGGLATLGENFARSHWGGTMNKIDKLDAKTNPFSIITTKLGLFDGLGGTSTHQEEANRANLAKQGINVSNPNVKEWELNPAFAVSRNESDLKAPDIIHAAQFYTDIPGYDKLSKDKQVSLASEALKQGLIREEHGQIDLDNNSDFQTFTKNLMSAPDQQPATAPIPGTAMSSVEHRSISDNQSNNSLNNQIINDAKKQQKRTSLSSLLSSMPTVAPNYQTNPSPLINNPYL